MKQKLTIGLMLVVLMGMNASCSKRVNKKVPAIAKQQQEELAAKDALKEKQKIEAAKLEEDKKLQERIKAAIPLEFLIRSQEDETVSSLSLYQLVLSSNLLGVKSTVVAKNTDAGEDHDFKKELEDIRTLTKTDSMKICENIFKNKRNSLKNDDDLVSIDREVLHRNIDEKIECRGLSLNSNYITKKDLVQFCDSIAASLKTVEKIETQKVTKTQIESEAPAKMPEPAQLNIETEKEEVKKDAVSGSQLDDQDIREE